MGLIIRVCDDKNRKREEGKWLAIRMDEIFTRENINDPVQQEKRTEEVRAEQEGKSYPNPLKEQMLNYMKQIELLDKNGAESVNQTITLNRSVLEEKGTLIKEGLSEAQVQTLAQLSPEPIFDEMIDLLSKTLFVENIEGSDTRSIFEKNAVHDISWSIDSEKPGICTVFMKSGLYTCSSTNLKKQKISHFYLDSAADSVEVEESHKKLKQSDIAALDNTKPFVELTSAWAIKEIDDIPVIAYLEGAIELNTPKLKFYESGMGIPLESITADGKPFRVSRPPSPESDEDHEDIYIGEIHENPYLAVKEGMERVLLGADVVATSLMQAADNLYDSVQAPGVLTDALSWFAFAGIPEATVQDNPESIERNNSAEQKSAQEKKGNQPTEYTNKKGPKQ